MALGNARIDGLLRASVCSNNYFSCDSFSFTVAAGFDGSPQFNELLNRATDYVELQAVTSTTGDIVPLISGMIDRVVCDPILGTFYAEGRDMSAALIDSYLQQDFVNQSVSEVVTAMAAQHGLLAVATPTTDFIGRYFEDGFSRLSLGDYTRFRSKWDLIVELAREQGFDAYVTGRTLCFGPLAVSSAGPIDLTPADVMSLQLEHDGALLGPLTVGVQTWDTQQLTSYRGIVAGPAGGLQTVSRSAAPTYLYSHPNLTASQADARAAMYSREITRFRNAVRIEMPWDLRINLRGFISLSRTSTPFDGLCAVDCVERFFCSSTGSTQSVSAVTWLP